MLYLYAILEKLDNKSEEYKRKQLYIHIKKKKAIEHNREIGEQVVQLAFEHYNKKEILEGFYNIKNVDDQYPYCKGFH